MRRALVAANWKMHGNHAFINTFLSEFLSNEKPLPEMDCVLIPPFVYLAAVSAGIANTVIQLGGQNVSHVESGAFTGEIAASMLADNHCRYVLIGHSERRQYYHEDDELLAAKFVAAQAQKLIPILCVGETLAVREAGNTTQVIEQQLAAVIEHAGIDALANAVIAYEPVWAIGTGVSATPEQAQQVHAMIRQTVAAKSATIAEQLRIIYGGSVKENNASALFAMADIDGGLIGGASLNAQSFFEICQAAR